MLFEWVGGGGGFLTALTLLGLFLVNRTLTAYILYVVTKCPLRKLEFLYTSNDYFLVAKDHQGNYIDSEQTPRCMSR